MSPKRGQTRSLSVLVPHMNGVGLGQSSEDLEGSTDDAIGDSESLKSEEPRQRKRTTRIINKDGTSNVCHVNVEQMHRRFFFDLFTTIIDLRWRWCLLLITTVFVTSWVIFATIYYLAMVQHGDFAHSLETSGHEPCIMNVKNYSFVAVFLFSLETQVTIGYGYRYISDQCPVAITILCIQTLSGILLQSFMIGLFFAKLAHPKRRGETLVFSKNAVINQRDGKLCFMFRVGDMRTSHLVEAHMRVQMIKATSTEEGEVLPYHQFDMNVGYDSGLDRIFLVWPVTICHEIDEDSPLYEYSAEELETADFEIIVILEGIVQCTGLTAQIRTSYLPSEILWGHRFEALVACEKKNRRYKIDHHCFDKTFRVRSTRRLSAKDIHKLSTTSTEAPAMSGNGATLIEERG